tara:strand:+ start:171 stop:452 length:282 start_codon:yes stop_codon:yes gene_type:complete
MNIKKLNIARKKIDKLDNKLFQLIKQRTNIVRQMLRLKKNKKEIIDHRRMNIIFKNIKKKSLKNKIDPRLTHKIWKAIIWSYVDFQKRNFKKK